MTRQNINHENNPIKICTWCGVVLNHVNQLPSNIKINRHLCKDCTTEKANEARKSFKVKHPGRYKTIVRQMSHRRRWKAKRLAMEKLGGCKCVRCGINDIRILTINHKKGDGGKERRANGHIGEPFYRDIILGRRAVDDLEVRCYNCNVLYEYEVGNREDPEI